MRRILKLLLLIGIGFAFAKPGPPGNNRPHGNGNNGQPNRPPQSTSKVDASQGTESASQAVKAEAELGRKTGNAPSQGENPTPGSTTEDNSGNQTTPNQAASFPDDFTMPADVTADTIAAHADQRSIPGVKDEVLPEYIEDIISTPGTTLRSTPNGTSRMAWWDEATGTMIIREGNHGTFMQPDRGHEYFLEQTRE